MSNPLARAAARLLRATLAVDAAYRGFDRARSLVVSRVLPDRVLDAYNDLTYARTPVYNASSSAFRQGLFNWEADLVARVFPPAPARVLLGGAGGGREAFALAGRGYEVVAFDPSPALAESMAAHAPASGGVRVLVGRYEDLPRLATPSGTVVDLGAERPFDAALFGWTSFSHLRHRRDRVRALSVMAEVTNGPVAVSFFWLKSQPRSGDNWRGRLRERVRLTGAGDYFTPYIGFYHQSTRAEIESEIGEARAEIVAESFDDSDGRWPWIAIRRELQRAE